MGTPETGFQGAFGVDTEGMRWKDDLPWVTAEMLVWFQAMMKVLDEAAIHPVVLIQMPVLVKHCPLKSVLPLGGDFGNAF